MLIFFLLSLMFFGLKIEKYLVKLGFPFAKLLRNFCGTKRKIFLSFRISFARKTTICAIIRKSHFAQKCPFPFLQNSSFAQFRNQSFLQFRCVFLRIQFWKNLVFECLPIGHFYIISQFSRKFKFWTCIFPKSGFFRHWLLSCIILYETKMISEI